MEDKNKTRITHSIAGAILLSLDFVIVASMFVWLGWWSILFWVSLGTYLGLKTAKKEEVTATERWLESMGVSKH
jgi:uncharacterized membrane protein